MKRLMVYWNDSLVGMLDQNKSGLLAFRYGEEWLDRPDALPISRSLPLQADPFQGKRARAFFAGIHSTTKSARWPGRSFPRYQP